MRCDQWAGLNEVAWGLIHDGTMEPSGKYYHDRYGLSRYRLADGRVFEEDIQAEPWSSGPVFFLALKDEHGEWAPESLWSEEQINNA